MVDQGLTAAFAPRGPRSRASARITLEGLPE